MSETSDMLKTASDIAARAAVCAPKIVTDDTDYTLYDARDARADVCTPKIVTDDDTDDVVLQELLDSLSDLQEVVSRIARLRRENFFRYLTKDSRNVLLNTMVEHASRVDDVVEAAFKSLKKNKRERVPVEVTDLLLFGNRLGAIIHRPTVAAVSNAPDNE